MILIQGGGTIAQMHFRASNANLGILNFFEIRPVVLVRNIFEVLVSIHNHLGALYADLGSSTSESWFVLPHGHDIFVDKGYFSLSDSAQLDLIIDNMLPWYFNFYASWRHATDGGQDALMLDFSLLKNSELEFFSRVLDFWGVGFRVVDLEACIHKVNLSKQASRIDVGRPKHARVKFSEDQRNRVIRRAGAYSYLDFQGIL